MTLAQYFQIQNPRGQEIVYVGTLKKIHQRGRTTLVGTIQGDSLMLVDSKGESSGIYPLSYFVKRSLRPITLGDVNA